MSGIDDYRMACADAIERVDGAASWEDSSVAIAEAQRAANDLTRAVREAGFTGVAMLDQTPEWGHIADAQIRRQRRFDREG